MSSSKGQSYIGSSEAHLSHTSFTWTLVKFSYRMPSLRVDSPAFTDEEKNEFHLCLTYDIDEFLYLNIIPNKLTENSLEVKYKFRIDASVGFQPLSFEGFWRFEEKHGYDRGLYYTGLSIPTIISHKTLLNRPDVYLQGEKDTLTIHCEMFHVSKDKTSLITVNGPSQESVCKEKTLADYGNFLKSGNFADVKLLVGGKTLSVHKSFLAARSPVFAAMFSHDTLEKQKGQVVIPDLNPEAFEAFLAFLYTGTLPTLGNVKSAEELLIISDKYDCGQLKTVCEDYLITNLTIETAPNLLLLANSVNATKLKASSVEFMRGRGSELFDALQNDPDQMVNLFQCLAMKNQEKEQSK